MSRVTRRSPVFAVLALGILLTGSLHAKLRRPSEAVDLAQLSFSARVRPDVPAVVRVALRSDETLRIVVELYPQQRGSSDEPRLLRRTRHLGAAAFDDLLLDVKVLSNAEVEISRGPVCRVVPTPLSKTGELDVLRDYDPGTDTFSGDLARIAQDRWCWDPAKYRLTDPRDAERAHTFQAKLGILATQMLRAILVEARIP